jgi:hypothetical protein
MRAKLQNSAHRAVRYYSNHVLEAARATLLLWKRETVMRKSQILRHKDFAAYGMPQNSSFYMNAPVLRYKNSSTRP